MLQPTGITAIYSTDTVRTLGTAGPLADQLQLEPILYETPEDLAERLLSSNRGDVVLVVGHSNTLGPIARALGGEVPEQTVGDYDNLLVVTRAKRVVNVMNLQFGEESSPDLMKTHNQGSQLMLVEEATGSDQVERLAHRLRKAGLEALLATGGHTSFSAISGRLGLPIQSLDPGSLSDSIRTLLRDHPRQNVAVSTAGPILADIYAQLTGEEESLDALPRSGLLLVTPYDEGVRATGIVY